MHIRILKALADETRLRILNLLYEGELCVCDIEALLGISQTNVSRHLAILKNASLVQDRKQAQWVYYTRQLADETNYLDELIQQVLRRKKKYLADLAQLKAKKRDCTSSSKIGIGRNKKGASNE